MQVLVLIVQNAVPYSELGVATSGATFFRSIGGSFGTAIFGAIFSNVLVGNLVRHLGHAQAPAAGSQAASVTPAILDKLPHGRPPRHRRGLRRVDPDRLHHRCADRRHRVPRILAHPPGRAPPRRGRDRGRANQSRRRRPGGGLNRATDRPQPHERAAPRSTQRRRRVGTRRCRRRDGGLSRRRLGCARDVRSRSPDPAPAGVDARDEGAVDHAPLAAGDDDLVSRLGRGVLADVLPCRLDRVSILQREQHPVGDLRHGSHSNCSPSERVEALGSTAHPQAASRRDALRLARRLQAVREPRAAVASAAAYSGRRPDRRRGRRRSDDGKG